MGTDKKRLLDVVPLRAVEFEILLSLAVSERHGYGIILDIESRDGGAVPDVGTMYRALARMVEQGLIASSSRRPAPDADDERRNYYRITDTGRRAAQAEARRLQLLTRTARSRGLLQKS